MCGTSILTSVVVWSCNEPLLVRSNEALTFLCYFSSRTSNLYGSSKAITFQFFCSVENGEAYLSLAGVLSSNAFKIALSGSRNG